MENLSELYSRENVVVTSAMDVIEPLPIMEELDAIPTLEEPAAKPLRMMASHLDLIRHCKTTFLQPVHDTLCQCWSESGVPQDTRDAKIVTLYKNKSSRSDCNNYRCNSLLSIVCKLYARVLSVRLQQLAECV